MNNISYWNSSVTQDDYPKLSGEISVDTVVIGGGMAGMCIAYMLKKEGQKVAVIDAGLIGRGNTANTTAKITCQHDLCYERLIKQHGKEKAKMYAEANSQALSKLEEIINTENISCDLKKADSYVYATTGKGMEDIEKEMRACIEIDIEADIATETDLPFDIKSAIRIKNQAMFHPLKFIKELGKIINSDGSYIFQNTVVSEVIDNNEIITDSGHISANNVVIATHFPIINTPGLYFLKMYQSRSHAVAFKGKPIKGIYVSAEQDGFSLRSQNTDDGEIVIMVGADYKTGHADNNYFYKIMEDAAKRIYGDVEILYRWSAQDCMPIDYLPYIGRYSMTTPKMYVATGFAKWGMSGSMAAAILISDLITKGKSKYEELYNPSRFDPISSAKEFASSTGDVAVKLTTSLLRLASDKLSEIENGSAGIVNIDNHRIGIYKDETGKVHAVNTVCTHLGCALSWNNYDHSWDCPCHGSRFDIDGKVLDSPAIRPVEKVEISYE